MSYQNDFISELKHEAALTMKMLERVPLDKADWKPHEKSMTIGRLATHVAECPQWISRVAGADMFDFLENPFTSYTAASSAELVGIMQKNVEAALVSLAAMSEEDFEKIWTVKRGEQVYFTLPKKAAIRSWALSHMIHHRGQLSVYLRLAGVPVPGMYGPTADEAFS